MSFEDTEEIVYVFYISKRINMSFEDTEEIVKMGPTTYVALKTALGVAEKVSQFLSNTLSVLKSEMLITFLITSLLFFAFFIVSAVSLKYLVHWRIKQCLWRTPNRIIFAGQVMLLLSLLFSTGTVQYFPEDGLYSFQLYSLSCSFLVAFVFLSYDYRHPPPRKVGYLVCFVGVLTALASLYLVYREMFSEYRFICFILGLNEFAIGSVFVMMNSVQVEYVCYIRNVRPLGVAVEID